MDSQINGAEARSSLATGSALLEAAMRYGRREMRIEDDTEISRARKPLYPNPVWENDGDVAARVLAAEIDRLREVLAAIECSTGLNGFEEDVPDTLEWIGKQCRAALSPNTEQQP